MQWQWIIGPAIGSLIGYITNDIAVRMLFRPREEKRIFGKRVPFTPGLIPKERSRLARAVRDVLDHELLNPQVLEEALLSERMLGQIDNAVDRAITHLSQEQRTPRMLLEGFIGEEAFHTMEAEAKYRAGLFLMEKLLESGLEHTIAEIAVEEARNRVNTSTAGISKLFWDDRRSASMEASLSQSVREMLATHGPGFLNNAMDNVLRDGLDTPIAELVSRYADKSDAIRQFLVTQYQNVIRATLPAALRALDLGQIVEDRLNSFNVVEMETLIMQVMRKELRAIVWLGALLGALMGLLNAALPYLF